MPYLQIKTVSYYMNFYHVKDSFFIKIDDIIIEAYEGRHSYRGNGFNFFEAKFAKVDEKDFCLPPKDLIEAIQFKTFQHSELVKAKLNEGTGVSEKEARSILGRLSYGWQFVSKEQLVQMKDNAQKRKDADSRERNEGLVHYNLLINCIRQAIGSEEMGHLVYRQWIKFHPVVIVNGKERFKQFNISEFVNLPGTAEFFVKTCKIGRLLKAFVASNTFLDELAGVVISENF